MCSDRIDHVSSRLVSSPRSHLLVLVMVRWIVRCFQNIFSFRCWCWALNRCLLKAKISTGWLCHIKLASLQIIVGVTVCRIGSSVILAALFFTMIISSYLEVKMCFDVHWFISIFFIVSSISIGLNCCSWRYANSEERAQSLSLTVLGSS